MEEYDGVIGGWWRDQVTKKEFVIWGTVIEDKKGRFKPGWWMRTSAIKNRPCEEGDIVQTRNSRYLLGRKHVESDDTGLRDDQQ